MTTLDVLRSRSCEDAAGATRVETTGVVVGAMYLPCRRQIQRCREVLEAATTEKFRFRSIDFLPEGGAVCHLPVSAASVVEAQGRAGDVVGASDVAAFMTEAGAEWLRGVRPSDPVFGRGLPFLDSNHAAGAPPGVSDAPFTFAELFAGIGGFRLGLEALGGKCVLASEIDRDAVDTYTKNFRDRAATDNGDGDATKKRRIGSDGSPSAAPSVVTDGVLVGDITGFYSRQLPNFDILTGGFPCQPFSNRGDQMGLKDKRGGLYLELVRFLRAKRPRGFVFENVVGLVLMDGGSRTLVPATGSTASGESTTTVFRAGATFGHMLDCFEASGYDVSWKIINARHWLPQFRERVYIVGRRQDHNGSGVGGGIGGGGGGGGGGGDTSGSSASSSDIWFDWSRVKPGEKEAKASAASTVRDIMEDFRAGEGGDESSVVLKYCVLTPSQWEVLKTQCRRTTSATDSTGDGCIAEADSDGQAARRMRGINLDSKAPTLASGYHR
jgi:DNA-cytosine methyltransferase